MAGNRMPALFARHYQNVQTSALFARHDGFARETTFLEFACAAGWKLVADPGVQMAPMNANLNRGSPGKLAQVTR